MPLSKSIDEIVETYDRYLGEDTADGDEPVPEAMLRSGLRRPKDAVEPFEGFVRAYMPDEDFVG